MTEEDRPLVRLPADHRDAFREPLGPIFTGVESMLADANGPVIAIGDVVAYHLAEADRLPAVAVIDGRTKRQAVDPDIEDRLAAVRSDTITATNPAGTITASLVRALSRALERDEPVQVVIDGEEDLATVPAILLAPTGATVVYGQPGEGMVRVEVSAEAKRRAADLFDLLTGDVDDLAELLDDLD